MQMKKLIMTADDFGLSDGVNRAVERAWKEGSLTCASIMPGGAAYEGAVRIAKRNPGLQIGLHLTLVQGRGVLPKERIAELVDHGGCFSNNPIASGCRYFFDRGLYPQLRREVEAQLMRLRDSGLDVSHIDGHLNIHMHPTIFRIIAELMPDYGIRSFRLSRENLAENLRFDPRRRFGKSLESFIFGRLAGELIPELDRLSVSYAGEVKGVLSSGRMTEGYLLDLLEGLTAEVTEIYFHPGILPDTELKRRMPDYRHEEELAALTSRTVRERLLENNIQLINYRGEVKC